MAVNRSPAYLGMASGFKVSKGRPVSGMDQYHTDLNFDRSTRVGYTPIENIGMEPDYLHDRAAAFARSVAEDAHAGMGNTDEQSNQRYQDLQAHREELKQKIMKLEADIAYQEKVRDLEMSNDPMWEAAKADYIYKGDRTGLDGIMGRIEAKKQRESTERISKESRDAEREDRQAANKRKAQSKRRFLQWAYDNYKANPSLGENLDNLFEAQQEYNEAVAEANMSDDDLWNDEGLTLKNIQLALDEGLGKRKSDYETAKKNQKERKDLDGQIAELNTALKNAGSDSAKRKAARDAINAFMTSHNRLVKAGKAKTYLKPDGDGYLVKQ